MEIFWNLPIATDVKSIFSWPLFVTFSLIEFLDLIPIPDADVSKDGGSEEKVSKIESDSPKLSSEKASVAAESVAQSSRATRRSKNWVKNKWICNVNK